MACAQNKTVYIFDLSLRLYTAARRNYMKAVKTGGTDLPVAAPYPTRLLLLAAVPLKI